MIVSTNLNTFALSVGPFVVTGRHFKKLKPFEREAIIAHEKGHIFHMHALKRIWWLMTFQWKHLGVRCQAQEFQADRFAVFEGHGDGLLHFLSRIKETHISPLHPTSGERVANIRRWLTYGK